MNGAPSRPSNELAAGAEPKPRRQGGLGLWIKAAISVSLLLALVWKFRNDLPSLRDIDARTSVLAVLLVLLQPPMIAWRWWILLRIYDSHLRLRSLVEITWVSIFANLFLPASVGGDAIRVFYARREGERLSTAVASVVVDRLVALFALAVCVVAFGPTLAGFVDERLITGLGLLCAVGLLVAFFGFRWLTHAHRHFARWPKIERLVHIAHYMLRVFAHPVQGLEALGLAIAVHLISFGGFWLIAYGIGERVQAMPFFAIAAVLTLVQVAPISIGGWGVREAAAVGLLGLLGVAPKQALLSAFVLGLAYAAAALPGAGFWLFRRANRDLASDAPLR